MEIKKIAANDANLKKYKSQTNIIRQTGSSFLNYGKIRIMTDMDPDGSDIQCLLIQFFSQWPDLFNQGRISRLLTPLFIARKENQPSKYFYTFEEFEAAKTSLKGYEIDYIKGLGSLSPDEYKETVIDHPKEVMIKLDDNYKASLEKAFGSESQLRKDWLMRN